MQKEGRIGSPCTVTWLGFNPAFSARVATASVGQKQVVTSLWNLGHHKGQEAGVISTSGQELNLASILMGRHRNR